MTIITTPTGIKFGTKGRVAKTPEAAGELFGKVSKSQARKARRHLHELGKINLAAAPRKAA